MVLMIKEMKNKRISMNKGFLIIIKGFGNPKDFKGSRNPKIKTVKNKIKAISITLLKKTIFPKIKGKMMSRVRTNGVNAVSKRRNFIDAWRYFINL